MKLGGTDFIIAKHASKKFYISSSKCPGLMMMALLTKFSHCVILILMLCYLSMKPKIARFVIQVQGVPGQYGFNLCDPRYSANHKSHEILQICRYSAIFKIETIKKSCKTDEIGKFLKKILLKVSVNHNHLVIMSASYQLFNGKNKFFDSTVFNCFLNKITGFFHKKKSLFM